MNTIWTPDSWRDFPIKQQPTYEDKKDKQKIFRLYNDLFSEQKEYPNAYPCAIMGDG